VRDRDLVDTPEVDARLAQSVERKGKRDEGRRDSERRDRASRREGFAASDAPSDLAGRERDGHEPGGEVCVGRQAGEGAAENQERRATRAPSVDCADEGE